MTGFGTRWKSGPTSGTERLRDIPAGGGSHVHALALVPTEVRHETRNPARHLALMFFLLDGEGDDER